MTPTLRAVAIRAILMMKREKVFSRENEILRAMKVERLNISGKGLKPHQIYYISRYLYGMPI